MIHLECRKRLRDGWSPWWSHVDPRVPGDVGLIAVHQYEGGQDEGAMTRWGTEWQWRVPAVDGSD